MLSQEEILIKLLQLLDVNMEGLKLKQTSQKQKFISQEESNAKYQEHLELIFDALNLDKRNNELFSIFQELLFLYTSIYKKLSLAYATKKNTKKINWILLKRLVVPFLSYRFANLDTDYNNRIDKNMPGGIFWYLPNIDDPKNIKMPIPYLMDWWLDLYGKGLDSLCDEIDNNAFEAQAFNSKDILKPWKYKNVIPSKKSLTQYLRKQLKYTGVFKYDKTKKVDIIYNEVLKFVQQTKKLSLEELERELPSQTLLKEIYSSGNINEAQKKEFIMYVSERWKRPLKGSLITKFLIARGVQDLYGRLIDYFRFNDSHDIEENKILQLVHQYIFLYNMQMARSQNKLNTNDLAYPLYHEMMEPFYAPFDQVINTIGGDITIELTNPKYKENIFEDIHLLKMGVFFTQKDDRLKKTTKDVKDHYEYFHSKYDDIDKKIQDYERLGKESFLKRIIKEDDFILLTNLYRLTQKKDYFKAEQICFQMEKISKNREQEIGTVSSFLGIYCDPLSLHNLSMYDKSRDLLEQLTLLLEDETYNTNEIQGVLFNQANFYLKSKNFNKSLKYFNEIFDLYAKNSKDDFSDLVTYLAAYCAYTTHDKARLRKYKSYLKKRRLPEFKTKKSLPFPIYFYK